MKNINNINNHFRKIKITPKIKKIVANFKIKKPRSKKKKKNKKFAPSFIFIVIGVIVIAMGACYGWFYLDVSKKISESEQLIKVERHDEAIEKLESISDTFAVKKLGIKGQYILTKIEESKRKIVEDQLTEETTAREEAEEKAQEEEEAKIAAEARAKQEEFEKELKEQQLLEKEAEEKRMNADNDNDGLTYREESSKGTSDFDSDSDGDGIVDSKDTHPAGGGRNIPQTFVWSYGGYNWTWTKSIQEDWYDYYKAKLRGSPESVEYITSNDPFIKKISKTISEGARDNNVGEVWLAVSFVQNLPYVEDVFTGYDEYPKYPVETFFEKNGDCEDTSYLTASIIDAMGYGSVLVLLPGHMAVGVYMDCDTPGTYYEVDGRCYYYIETTSEDFIGGEIPDRYRNTRATIIKIPSGETVGTYPQYVKPCYASPDFSGYYYDGNNYYSDSQCNNLAHCMPYKEYYVNPRTTTKLYWDSNCSQEVTAGCYKSDTYPGYFYDDAIEYYSDSRCILKARLCRPSPNYLDTYYDGYNEYWDSNCSQKVVSWCSKSTYHPGYFLSSLDYEYYYDSQCTQKANLY